MATFSIKVIDAQGRTKFVDSGEDMVSLVVTSEYQEGDRIAFETSQQNIHVWLQVDDALGASLVYVTDNVNYKIPQGLKLASHYELLMERPLFKISFY